MMRWKYCIEIKYKDQKETQKELSKTEFFLSLKGANNEDFKKRWTH